MKKDREASFSPLRGWGSPSILPLVNIHYGSYSTAGFEPRPTSSSYDRRSVDTALTMSDRYSRAVTSPPRGGVVDPVVVNAGFTFRLTEPKATYIHNHVHVDPASAVTKTASSYLSKEIDKFLKKSDHSLDRFQKLLKGKTPPPNEISSIKKGTPVSKEIFQQEMTSPYVKAPLKPPRLFSVDKITPSEEGFSPTLENEGKPHHQEPTLSSYTKPSIAEQAERHRQILSRVMKSAAGAGETKDTANHSVVNDDSETLRHRSSISSSSSASSSDDLDGSFEDAVVFDANLRQEKSDDTSAEISKLEDLSSGSDDEFFDVQPLPGYFHIPGRQQIRPTGVIQAPLMPVGSISGPSIPNRFPIHSYSLPAVNKLHPSTKMGNKQPMTNTSSQGLRGNKKYPAPPPPVSREASLLSLSSETNRSSLDESTLNTPIDSSSLNGDVSLGSLKKKIRRNPSLKKYPAPQPPMSGDSQKTSVNCGDTSTFPTENDSVMTTSDSKVPLNNESYPLAKPSPDSTRKLGNKRPGSPVPFRSALFPLGKNSNANIPNDSGNTNSPLYHNKINESSNPAISSNKLETPVASKYNTHPFNAASTPNKTLSSPSKNLISSKNTSNSNYTKSSSSSGNKKSSSGDKNVNSSIITSSDKTESLITYPTFSDESSSAQNSNALDNTSISSSTAVTSIQSSSSASTKAFNTASSTVLSSHIASTSVLKNTNSSSIECQEGSKKTSRENLNPVPTQPLEKNLEVLPNGGLESVDKKQSNETQSDSSKNSSFVVESTSSSIKQDDPKNSKIAASSMKSNSTTHDSELSEVSGKQVEATTDLKQDSKKSDIPSDSTKSESTTKDSKQSESATDSTNQDKTTKKVKKKKVSSDKNPTIKDGVDERRSRSSSVTSSRSVTPDKGLRPVPRKSISGKLVALTTKFEPDENAEKNLSLGKKILGLGGGGGTFASDKSESKGKVVGKLSNPYSKPFSPESTIKEKKNNIGGIDISMFGGLGKPKKPSKKDDEKDDKKKSEKTTKYDEKEKKTEIIDKKEIKKQKKEEKNEDKKEDKINKDSEIELPKQDIVTDDIKKISNDKRKDSDEEKSKPIKIVNGYDDKNEEIKIDNSKPDLEIKMNETVEKLSSEAGKDEDLNKNNNKVTNEISSEEQSHALSEKEEGNQSSITSPSGGTKAEENSLEISVKKCSEVIKDITDNQIQDFAKESETKNNENVCSEMKNSFENSIKEKNEKIEEKLGDQDNSLTKNETSGSINTEIVCSEEKDCKVLLIEGKEIEQSDVLHSPVIDKSDTGTPSDINQSDKVTEAKTQHLNIMKNTDDNSDPNDKVEKPNVTNSTEQESDLSISITSQNELNHEILKSKTSEDLIIQPEVACKEIEHSDVLHAEVMEKSDEGTLSSNINQSNIMVEVETHHLNTSENTTKSQIDLDQVQKLNLTNSAEQKSNLNINITSHNEFTPEICKSETIDGPVIQHETTSSKKQNGVSPTEQSTLSVNDLKTETPIADHDKSIMLVSSKPVNSCDIQDSNGTVKSENTSQESIALISEIQSLSSVLKPAEQAENTEMQSLPPIQILSEKSLCSENDISFPMYRPSALTPIPEVSLPGSPVLPSRDILAAVTDSIGIVDSEKVLPGSFGENNNFTPSIDEHEVAKDSIMEDNCQFSLPKVFIDITETSGETFNKFEDSCSTGSFGTPPSDRASSDEMFVYEPRISSENINVTSHGTEQNIGVTPATIETEAPPLSLPCVKQFIDMSRSPSEMIQPSIRMPQKPTSLLQRVSDLFQTLVSKDTKGIPPSLESPVVKITQEPASIDQEPVSIDQIAITEMEGKPDKVDTDGNFSIAAHSSIETSLYPYLKGEESQTIQPEMSKVEGLTHQHQLSVRPKTRRTARGSSIPAEVLNVSEIIREADERLSRALSKSASDMERLQNNSPTHLSSTDIYDPSRFDTLMPLPNADEINMIDKTRSRSITPFMDRFERSPTPKRVMEETEALLTETDRILRKTRSQHSLRRSFANSLSGANLNRLTEVTADLSEEHSTAHLASERIEAEQSERMRLEEEVAQLQMDVKRMTSLNDKLEMEKLTLRNEVLQHAEVNGDVVGDEEEGGGSDASLYKRKYEWAMREIEVLKKQLKQQQEDDLDQLLVLKKQLEKKVTDAYEETDEQRQVVAQMKKKSQRLQAEMNDMKILLEEQTSRNNLLEKKQRKFDQEMQSVVEEQRNERLAKEKIQRERDQILSEKYSFEQEVSTLKLELEMKEDKIAVLTRELSDLNFTGKAEEEVAVLKKAKHDLELKVKDQEEELDDLAGQVQMLEAARIRLEMSIEQTRKENRRELAQRDEEMEEVRVSAQKKIKGLEAQLESEHDERTALVREKHDLERRLVDAHSRSFASVDEEAFHRVKKELKKTKALLKDTQTMLEKTQSEGSNKLLMRQLKTQLEDAEFAKNAAIKARQSAESDFSELQSQMEEALRAKKDTEDKLARVTKEKSEVQTQLEESEEEVAEVMKKYKATVSQLSVDQVNMSEQAQLISDLEHDKQVLQDRLTELSSKVEVLEGETANIHTQRRLQMKIKELESKLDLELTTRQRLESQITRLKDQVEKLSSEIDSIRMKEMQAVDHGKKLNRQLREAKEDSSNLQQKLTDSTSRKQEIEKQYELAESEIMTLKSDLKLAFKRIEDLQQALQGDLSDSDTEMSESTGHDLRIHDVVMGGASLMTSIREEDGKESYA